MKQFRLLRPDEIECRVAQCNEKGASILLYKTARTDADLLDETVGAQNWENDFKLVDGVLYGGIGVDYAWVLMNKLADKLNMGVRDLYRHYIPDIPENSQVVCVPTEAVEKLQSGWEHNGIGWCSDTLKSKLPGCTNVVLYYGSSTFDQKQMGVLLDLIIEDCKQVGVEYLTPEELERLKGEWDA